MLIVFILGVLIGVVLVSIVHFFDRFRYENNFDVTQIPYDKPATYGYQLGVVTGFCAGDDYVINHFKDMTIQEAYEEVSRVILLDTEGYTDGEGYNESTDELE